MKHFLSIINLSGLLLFCHGAAGVDIVAVRQPGTSLDTSVRNEVDNARRLAAEWLIVRQQPDGSWGGTNCNTVLTPMVWLALKSAESAVDAVRRDRAVVWLDSQPLAPSTSLDVYTWRLLVVAQALPDSPERQTRVKALLDAMETPNDRALFGRAGEYSRRLRWEVVLPFCVAPAKPSPYDEEAQRMLVTVAQDYPLDTQNPETFWHFARLINRYGKGVWVRGTEALDWRNDFAQTLINAQRKDPTGGGYWNAGTDDDKIRATAFALLALREID